MSETYVYGIDVSYAQGEIDWVKVKATQAIKFAILKATEGVTIVDNHLFKNASALNGILPFDSDFLFQQVGVYHYFIPTDNPKTQAIFFATTLKNAIQAYPKFATYLTNPALSYIVVDVEKSGGLDADNCVRALYAFLEEADNALEQINILDSVTLVYTNNRTWNECYYPVKAADAQQMLYEITHYRDLWLADWTGSVNKYPTIPLGWNQDSLAIWQYTNTGMIEGINGFVDFSVKTLF